MAKHITRPLISLDVTKFEGGPEPIPKPWHVSVYFHERCSWPIAGTDSSTKDAAVRLLATCRTVLREAEMETVFGLRIDELARWIAERVKVIRS